ncbi:hypothetical protein QAD02_008019 [Eretmocerus hayati]|uniref:Uncharacterized protein n=1 Tax=Eretmocerus hayati TaxID=131215 RepID=A0ACC2N7Q1_9HYME|nr:hypothetical protein QAD02_008019 [Eretmocerus hayati]
MKIRFAEEVSRILAVNQCNRLKQRNFAQKRKNSEATQEKYSEIEDEGFHPQKVIFLIPRHEGTGESTHSCNEACAAVSNENSSNCETSSDDDGYNSDDSDIVDGSNDEDSEKLQEDDISAVLKRWAKECFTPRMHLDKLLKALHRFHSTTLPLSSKTLLKPSQPIKYEIEKLNSFSRGIQAEFVYFGIADQLKAIVNPSLREKLVLPLQFNVDGLTLYNSSAVEFWALSGKIYTRRNYDDPFPIAIHSGVGKPQDLEHYFEKFINEINFLMRNGIVIEEKKFCVRIHCFICDRPARSFIKKIKGHGGFWACERCEVRGCRPNRTTYYPVNEAPMRTDASFRNQDNEEHQHGDDSPLCKIEPRIDMVYDFILDFMHKSCLGDMKKLTMDYWFKVFKHILTREQILPVSQRLMNLSSQIPEEFQRTRSLADMCKWKATEWRFFLLYAGPLIMNGILPPHYWKNFMLFSVGSLILNSDALFEAYLDEAEQHMNLFCETAPELYGDEVLVTNMHSVSHIARDVRNEKCPLTLILAFFFENFLGKLKNCIRSGNKPLQQLCNRIQDYLENERPQKKPEFKILKMKKDQNADIMRIYKVQYHDCNISVEEPNNTVLLNDGSMMRVKSMHSSGRTHGVDGVIIKGEKIPIEGLAFDYPTDSSIFKIFKVEDPKTAEIIEAQLGLVQCKMLHLSIYESLEDEKNDSYVMPLLHMN